MKYVKIGNSGLYTTEVTFGSALTIGIENNSVDFAQTMIDTAWKLGIRSFDVANHYGNGETERLLGVALSKYDRQAYIIATKACRPVGDTVYFQGLSRKHLRWSLEQSLQRLNMKYVDIFYAHRYDPNVSMEEIVRSFNSFIAEGKILYWATSEWPLSALEECFDICNKLKLEPPICEQFIYSYAVQKSVTGGVKAFCQKNGMGTFGFSALCQGWLTGKYKYGIPKNSRVDKASKIDYNKTINFYEQYKDRIDAFLNICDKYNEKPSQVAITWCLKNNVNPIIGASKPEQLEDAIGGLTKSYNCKMWEELFSI